MSSGENNIEYVIWRNNEDTHTLKCSECGEDLLLLTELPEELNKEYKYYVNCPFCGNKSFPKKTVCKTVYLPVEGLSIVDIQEEDEVINIEVVKNV